MFQIEAEDIAGEGTMRPKGGKRSRMEGTKKQGSHRASVCGEDNIQVIILWLLLLVRGCAAYNHSRTEVMIRSKAGWGALPSAGKVTVRHWLLLRVVSSL